MRQTFDFVCAWSTGARDDNAPLGGSALSKGRRLAKDLLYNGFRPGVSTAVEPPCKWFLCLSTLVDRASKKPVAVVRRAVTDVQESVVVKKIERRWRPFQLEFESRRLWSGEVEGWERDDSSRRLAAEDLPRDQPLNLACQAVVDGQREALACGRRSGRVKYIGVRHELSQDLPRAWGEVFGQLLLNLAQVKGGAQDVWRRQDIEDRMRDAAELGKKRTE